MNLQELEAFTKNLRSKLLIIWADDTRAPNSTTQTLSAGHCAVTARLIKELLPASRMVSTKIEGQSHWFNQVAMNGYFWTLDLTPDQFDPEVEYILTNAPEGPYTSPKVRNISEINEETNSRYRLLQSRLNKLLESE